MVGQMSYLKFGTEDTFRLAWECARPNAIVTIVALYDQPQFIALAGDVW